MAAAWKKNTDNKHHAILLLAFFLAPMACHGGVVLPVCGFQGWDRLLIVGQLTCPSPSPSPSPNPPAPPPPSGEGLHDDYYNSKYSDYACPKAEAIVREVVEYEIKRQGPRIGAGLIRLHFHDCFVQGCDGSVLLNTTASKNNDTEREGPPNKKSLRGFDVIDKAKDALEERGCARGKVSCADILAFAARDASYFLSGGKINYTVPAGRYDGRESFANQTNTLPGPSSGLATLKAMFAAQGLNSTDLVLLSAAHSCGKARCIFKSSSMGNKTLAADLDRQCQNNNDKTKEVNQDYATADVLDSQYYDNVVDGSALFDSDAALNSTQTNELVQRYKKNSENEWEKDFGKAMAKMGKIKIKTKDTKGAEIRKQCWTYNA